MQKKFHAYNPYTDKELEKIWQECIFSFDSCVLLNLYKFKPELLDDFFKILEAINRRIWLPFQVGHEFYVNRQIIINEQINAYRKIKEELNDLLSILIKALKDKNKKHCLIDMDSIKDIVMETKNKVELYLDGIKSKHPDYSTSDEISKKVNKLFDGRIGENYPEEKLFKMHKRAEKRIKGCIPPGYEDRKHKKPPELYGDVIIWLQLIDQAKSQKKPIIFVTEENKDDWWLKNNKKIIGPRPQLRCEMLNEAGVSFQLYLTDNFLEDANRFLGLPKQQKVIDEIVIIRSEGGRIIPISISAGLLDLLVPLKVGYFTKEEIEKASKRGIQGIFSDMPPEKIEELRRACNFLQTIKDIGEKNDSLKDID